MIDLHARGAIHWREWGACKVGCVSGAQSGQAGLVAHRDDGYIHIRPVKARTFYRCLRGIYSIVKANARNHGDKPQGA